MKTKASKPATKDAFIPAEFGDYKGNPLIILKEREDSKWPFQFGKAKARLIVQHFAEIKAFAEGK